MTCPFECMNDGICVMFMKRHMCNCKTGYTGDACQVSYFENPSKSVTIQHLNSGHFDPKSVTFDMIEFDRTQQKHFTNGKE